MENNDLLSILPLFEDKSTNVSVDYLLRKEPLKDDLEQIRISKRISGAISIDFTFSIDMQKLLDNLTDLQNSTQKLTSNDIVFLFKNLPNTILNTMIKKDYFDKSNIKAFAKDFQILWNSYKFDL